MKYYIIIILLVYNSCSYPKLSRDELIYENNFENENLQEIDGGSIMSYNNTKVIGNYNNDGFTLHLSDLGAHDYVYISFDLYIHGSWDGNFNGFNIQDHGFDDKPELLIFGMLSSLLAAGIWLVVASKYGWPVSISFFTNGISFATS